MGVTCWSWEPLPESVPDCAVIVPYRSGTEGEPTKNGAPQDDPESPVSRQFHAPGYRLVPLDTEPSSDPKTAVLPLHQGALPDRTQR